MSEPIEAIISEALREVYDPCCRDKGISVVDCCTAPNSTEAWRVTRQPQWALQAFWDFQIPQDLCEGYGYPQLTDQAKRKILGENLLRLHGMEVDDTVARLGRKQSA